jgi:hypothetical protein
MIAFSGVQRTAPPVRVTRLLTAAVTAAGQSIVLCLDDRPLKLLVIDQHAGQKSNVVMRE